MTTLIIVLAIIFLVVGLAGCIVPVLPGVPIAFAALLLLVWLGYPVGWAAIALAGVLTLAVVILDYVIPALGVKWAGGSSYGKWGCVVGTLVGMFFFPVGLILGPFLGALVGELFGNRTLDVAMKSAVGSLVGFLIGTVLKVAVTFYIIFVALSALI